MLSSSGSKGARRTDACFEAARFARAPARLMVWLWVEEAAACWLLMSHLNYIFSSEIFHFDAFLAQITYDDTPASKGISSNQR